MARTKTVVEADAITPRQRSYLALQRLRVERIAIPSTPSATPATLWTPPAAVWLLAVVADISVAASGASPVLNVLTGGEAIADVAATATGIQDMTVVPQLVTTALTFSGTGTGTWTNFQGDILLVCVLLP